MSDDRNTAGDLAPNDLPAPGGEAGMDAIAPRVIIEAFCSSPDFASAMQSAAKDRRMAKTTTTVHMGGPEAAAKRFTQVQPPHLIIVESERTGFDMFGELERLAAVCAPETVVIVAASANDVSIYRELLRQGVAEYLVTPVSPLQLIDAIVSVFDEPETAPAGRVITVYGVTGGAGGSVLSHNLAWTIAELSDRETILVDLDIEFGTAALDYNADTKHSVADALSDLAGLDDVKLARLLYAQTPKLKLLPAPAAINLDVFLDETGVLTLIDAVRFASDYVVIDTPRVWNDGVRCALEQADEVVLVATPDLASLRNLKTIYDWVTAVRENDQAPRIVVNQLGAPKRPEIPVKDFSDIIGADVALEVPFDCALFGSALNNGQMLAEVARSHKIVGSLEDFARSLARLKTPAAAGRGGFGSIELGSLMSSVRKRVGR